MFVKIHIAKNQADYFLSLYPLVDMAVRYVK